MKKNITQNIGFLMLFLCIIVTLIFLGSIIYFITARGVKVISWEFLTQGPKMAMTQGGGSTCYYRHILSYAWRYFIRASLGFSVRDLSM